MINAAKYELSDISVLKHLLTTASFAKKFCDPKKLNASGYVNAVKYCIVLTKLRNSGVFARAITYRQLANFKPKNVIRMLLKYRDYKLAITVDEQLSLKNLHVIYEEWCSQMLRHSEK